MTTAKNRTRKEDKNFIRRMVNKNEGH